MSLLLNTGAMHYRENVNDDWKPLVIKANADLTVLADEYSNASTYVVGEYCRYDGQLYRCTTAITTAESWTPAHWTETNIGDELESIKGNYLPLTAGAGKPLTGTLNIYGANNSPGLILKNGLADMSWTESVTRSWFLFCQDKDGDNSGFFSVNHDTTGLSATAIAASNISNGSAVNNALVLQVGRDGTRSVGLTSPSAWLSALGLGTSGALPLTIAQGGSGVTETQSSTTIANIITASSGVTINNAAYAGWGKVCQLWIDLKCSSAITASAWTAIGTIVSGKRPRWSAVGALIAPCVTGNVLVERDGALRIRGAISANTTITIGATYIIP